MKLKKRLWIFFDEFNTSPDVGIICEILCNRVFQGKVLPKNMVLIGACNPYKLKSKKIDFDENVGIKKKNEGGHNQRNLLHTVNPIPDTAIEQIWDFGQLTPEDNRKYIEEMLKECQFKQEKTMIEMLLKTHDYFKINEDRSSVSLRDIQRFKTLYLWFKESLEQKKKIQIL